MPLGLSTDVELWNAVRGNDEGAFAVLFDRYWKKLYYASFQYLKDRELSEEIVHDVFLSVWTRRKDLEILAIENFLVRAVRYQIYNHARTAKLTIVHNNTDAYESYASEQNKGEERILEQEFKNELHKHLSLLPKRCQKIFELSKVDGLTNQEIADNLGISKRSVENQLSLALKFLKGALKSAPFFLFFL